METMTTTVHTKFGVVKVKFIYDTDWEAEAFELRDTCDQLIGMIRGVCGENNDEIPEEFIIVNDDAEKFNIPAVTKLVEDYIDGDDFAYQMMTGSPRNTKSLAPVNKVNVLYVSDIDTTITSKVLLVINSECDRDVAIKAIVEAIKQHEGYDDSLDDDDPYADPYTDEEYTAKAFRMWEYGEEFYADRTYDSTFYLKKNMNIVG
jgi:hypothetical protein